LTYTWNGLQRNESKDAGNLEGDVISIDIQGKRVLCEAEKKKHKSFQK
jgi:hypothetical protein